MTRAYKKNMIIISIIVLIVICAIIATILIVLNSGKNDNSIKNNIINDETIVEEDDENTQEDKEEDNEEEDEKNNANSFAVQMFNVQFTVYEGEISGKQFKSLINTAIQSNQANPEHQVNPTSNNLESFGNIDENETYVVKLSYDDEGYVNSINIDKKIENDLNSMIDESENFINNQDDRLTTEEIQNITDSLYDTLQNR